MKKALLLLVIVIVLVVFSIAAWLFTSLRRPLHAAEEWKIITIQSGTSLRAIARQLREEKFISKSGEKSFVVAAILTKKARRLQPGRYQFSPSQSPGEILDQIAAGKIYTFFITIPEGYTINQIGELLETNSVGTKQDFIHLTSKEASEFHMAFLADGVSLEGYLFPDTYEISGQNGPKEIVEKMLRRFEDVVWKGIFQEKLQQNGLTLYQALTLASLVEKEARIEEERPVVAGVLLNRLQKGMRLECDATVQYALGKHVERILYSDLKIDSPYNTYLYPGLPPGPIGNPGRASIEAALHPAQTSYLFYVAKGDGSHVFTRTFTEHRAAIARIRRHQ